MNITITLEKMLCAKKENNWYFFRGTMENSEQQHSSVICKGSMSWCPQIMETLTLVGDYVTYKGERQFQFKSAKLTLPLDPRSQLHYICERSKGIGPAMEQQIWDLYGENFASLEFGKIKKLSITAFESFKNQWNSFSNNSEKAEVISYLENHGCSEGMAGAAYEKWGSDTAGIVNSNCYTLAQLPNYSFKTVDENVRRFFDIADDDPRRIQAAIEYALIQETEDGSTAVNCWRHFAACQKLLPGIGDNIIVEHVKEMKSSGNVYVFPDQNMMCLKKDFLNEQIIFDYICCAGQEEISAIDLEKLSSGESFTPDESQLEAVEFAIRNKFAVINGGAGVGKTTVIKMIYKGLKEFYPNGICLCAPTGKAAARLKEASGIEATTIHVALGAHGNDIFTAGVLDQCAMIVDEASMVDSALLAEILKRKIKHIVLVGDQAQLTPVGHGMPFHDIIQLFPYKVKTLTKCYRNKEAVFNAASKIRNGDIPMRFIESEQEKFTFAACANPEHAQFMIEEWVKAGYFDFETDIILAPKNGLKTEDGYQHGTVNGLNEALKAIDRAARGMDSCDKFLPGDRVINTVNNAEAHVWNGTTGTVHSVSDENIYVKLDVPYTDENGDKNDFVAFDKEMAKSLRDAYALTVHKSQGSQYRKVLLLCLARDKFQLDRSLIYTGVTRTKEECIVLGDYNAFGIGIQTTKKKDTAIQCLYLDLQD